jgi:methylase of polypeptide subunit release factors
MGTGAYAVVGLALWRQTACDVVATDIHPRILEQARANVALNRAPIRVVHSRFFDQLDEEFDVVAFNPPYVPSHLAQDPTYARPFDFQSDGGVEGTGVAAQFLEAFAHKGGKASACLAINGLFVPAKRARALLETRRELILEGVERIPGLPFYVFVLGRRK